MVARPTSRNRIARHRSAQRAQGLRAVVLWLPDDGDPGYRARLAEECRRLSRLTADEEAVAGGFARLPGAVRRGAVVLVGLPGNKFRPAGVVRSDLLSELSTATGGWAGLNRARELGAEATIAEVTASGLRGRGGAGFPAGIKWTTVAKAVPNAQIRRVQRRRRRQRDLCRPHGDGGRSVPADRGHGDCRLRGRRAAGLRLYPQRISACDCQNARGGRALGGDHRAVPDRSARGRGRYVCGEETSLLNSLEGKRGEVRAKPPLPALEGLFGKPTVVNNVLTLAAVPWVMAHGGAAYADIGFGRSRGTMPIQIAGNVRHGGLFEVGFGITLGELVDDIGGAPTAAARCARCKSAGRWARIIRAPISICRSIMKALPRPMA